MTKVLCSRPDYFQPGRLTKLGQLLERGVSRPLMVFVIDADQQRPLLG